MLKSFTRFFLMAPAVGASGFYAALLLNHALELLTQFALLLVVAIGLWVFAWLLVIQRLQASKHPLLKRLGELLGAGFVYTAIFQGLIYSVLVFWVIGTLTGQGELPEHQVQVLQEFILASGYLSMLFFGGTGATICCLYHRPHKKGLGLFLALLGLGLPPSLFFAFTRSWPDWVQTAPQASLFWVLSYYMLFSILSMSVLAGSPPDTSYHDIRKRKAKLKRMRK